jgi:hypothetical protein
MTFSAFRPFAATRPFRAPVGDGGKIRQPVLLVDALGNVLVDGDGNALTQGYRRVTP